MTIVFGAQNTSINFSSFFSWTAQSLAPNSSSSSRNLCALTHFGFSLCVFVIGTAWGWSCWRCKGKRAQSGQSSTVSERLAHPSGHSREKNKTNTHATRVFIMTADVIVAGPLDSDCNCEYPPLPPSSFFLLLLLLLLFLRLLLFHLPSLPVIVKKKKNFSPLSPVMFKPFMLLCGCVGRVHNEVSTRDQRKERKDAHWLENWLEWEKIGWERAERYCFGVRGRNIYIWLKLHYKKSVCTDWTNKRCVKEMLLLALWYFLLF